MSSFLPQDPVDLEILAKIDHEVVGRVMAGPEYSSFTKTSYALIVTWENAIYRGCKDNIANDIVCPVSLYSLSNCSNIIFNFKNLILMFVLLIHVRM